MALGGIITKPTFETSYKAESFGIRADGEDHSSEMDYMLGVVYAAGCGKIEWGPGTFRFDEQIVIPDNGETVRPLTGSWIFKGNGCWRDGYNAPAVSYNEPAWATCFDLRANAATGKIVTRGFGSLIIEGISFKNGGSAGYPFIMTTNTALQVRDCHFRGATVADAANCIDDAIILGGTSNDPDKKFTDDVNAPFQGYDSHVERCFFQFIRRWVTCNNNANAVTIAHNQCDVWCGGDYAIYSTSTGGQNVGGYVERNDIEVYKYTKPIRLEKSNGWVFVANSFSDPGPVVSTAYYSFDANSGNNIIIHGYDRGSDNNIIEDGVAGGFGHFISGRVYQNVGGFVNTLPTTFFTDVHTRRGITQIVNGAAAVKGRTTKAAVSGQTLDLVDLLTCDSSNWTIVNVGDDGSTAGRFCVINRLDSQDMMYLFRSGGFNRLQIPNKGFIVANNADGAGTGIRIGPSSTSGIGFHDATPTAQRASANQAQVAGTAGASYTATERGLINSLITLVNELQAALVEKGLIKGSA